MNILLFTAHFPAFDCPEKSYATPFLYNYAKEWAKTGANVTVVHFTRVYPNVFNLFANLVSSLGIKQFDRFIIDPSIQTEKTYDYNGVHIIRIPFNKNVPHGIVGKNIIKKIINSLDKYLSGYTPDVMIGDFVDPVLRVAIYYQKKFGVKYGQIVHNSDFDLFNKKEITAAIPQIDYWLFRSKENKNQVYNLAADLSKNYIYFYSGIPENVLPQKPTFRKKINNLLYVGALYKSKGLSTILAAMSLSANQNLRLVVVGKGPDEAFFKEQVKDLQLTDKVTFIGAVPHDKVFTYMRESDALVLISHETFGMVYVEAMSQGCIPIGVINDGIDGVVRNRVNGFLLPINDSKALAQLFEEMAKMDPFCVEELSKEAYETGENMTENVLAETVLNNIISERFE